MDKKIQNIPLGKMKQNSMNIPQQNSDDKKQNIPNPRWETYRSDVKRGLEVIPRSSYFIDRRASEFSLKKEMVPDKISDLNHQEGKRHFYGNLEERKREEPRHINKKILFQNVKNDPNYPIPYLSKENHIRLSGSWEKSMHERNMKATIPVMRRLSSNDSPIKKKNEYVYDNKKYYYNPKEKRILVPDQRGDEKTKYGHIRESRMSQDSHVYQQNMSDFKILPKNQLHNIKKENKNITEPVKRNLREKMNSLEFNYIERKNSAPSGSREFRKYDFFMGNPCHYIKTNPKNMVLSTENYPNCEKMVPYSSSVPIKNEMKRFYSNKNESDFKQFVGNDHNPRINLLSRLSEQERKHSSAHKIANIPKNITTNQKLNNIYNSKISLEKNREIEVIEEAVLGLMMLSKDTMKKKDH